MVVGLAAVDVAMGLLEVLLEVVVFVVNAEDLLVVVEVDTLVVVVVEAARFLIAAVTVTVAGK